jgi:hypothetical protein
MTIKENTRMHWLWGMHDDRTIPARGISLFRRTWPLLLSLITMKQRNAALRTTTNLRIHHTQQMQFITAQMLSYSNILYKTKATVSLLNTPLNHE